MRTAGGRVYGIYDTDTGTSGFFVFILGKILSEFSRSAGERKSEISEMVLNIRMGYHKNYSSCRLILYLLFKGCAVKKRVMKAAAPESGLYFYCIRICGVRL